jgi:hypothetical protein
MLISNCSMENEKTTVEGHMTEDDRQRWADRIVQEFDAKKKVRAARNARRRQRKRDAKRLLQRNASMGASGQMRLGSTKPMLVTHSEMRAGGGNEDGEVSDPERFLCFDGDLDPRPWSFDDSTDSEDEGFQLTSAVTIPQERREGKTADKATQWQLVDVEVNEWSMEAAVAEWKGVPKFNLHTWQWE